MLMQRSTNISLIPSPMCTLSKAWDTGKTIFLFLGLLLLVSVSSWGQSTYRQRDSLRTDGFRIGVELLWPLYTIGKPDQKQWEVMGDYGYDRHIGVLEIGQQYKRTSPGTDAGQLEVNGGYFRLGYEYNLLKNGDDVIFAGGRYGQATFVRTVSDLSVTSTYWGQTGRASVPDIVRTCGWLEAVIGAKVRLGWQLYLGLTARAGYRLYGNDFDGIAPNVVPGYGDALNNLNYNISYYLSFKIPTRTRAFIPEPKKGKK